MAAQHSVHPTGGSRRVFRQFAWLEVGSVKAALSRPAHLRVTQAVGPLAKGIIVMWWSQKNWRRSTFITLLVVISLSCRYSPEISTPIEVLPSPTYTPLATSVLDTLQEGTTFSIDNLAFTFLEHRLEGCFISKYGNEICPNAGASFLWLHLKRENKGNSSDLPIYSCFWFFLQYRGEEMDSNSSVYGSYADSYPDRNSWVGGGCEQLYGGSFDDGWIVFKVPSGIVLDEAILRVESYEGPKFEQSWRFGE